MQLQVDPVERIRSGEPVQQALRKLLERTGGDDRPADADRERGRHELDAELLRDRGDPAIESNPSPIVSTSGPSAYAVSRKRSMLVEPGVNVFDSYIKLATATRIDASIPFLEIIVPVRRC